MIVHERAVGFEDIDAAGLVFFARFFGYCHEAMERLFDGIPGGYVDLITRRKVGFPAVKVVAEYKAPLRYGDVARIALTVTRIGATSCTLRYAMTRGNDGVHVATIEHVVVSSDITTMTKIPLPDDCRRALAAHVTPVA